MTHDEEWMHPKIEDGKKVACYVKIDDIVHDDELLWCRKCKTYVKLEDLNLSDRDPDNVEDDFTADDIFPARLLQ